MRHSQKTKELGRKRNQRKALLNTLAVSLIRDGKIKTTETKAKVLRPTIERLVTKAKVGDTSALRFVATKVGINSAKTLVSTIAPKYKSRNGGYTRIIKLNDRLSDGSKMALIEFV